MKFSYILFVLSFLNIAVLLLFSEEVEERFTEGKCFKLVSYRVSRRVPYRESYKQKILGIFWQTRVRWNYRIEYTTQYRRDLVCCTGYWIKTHIGSNIQCEPNCPSTCKHGSCIRPNECICDKGYSNSGDIVFDSLCVPVCTHICVYGKCTAPEVCTCNHGYSMNADTHICEPVCTLLCLEGSYCSKPGYCNCLDGYVRADANSELEVAHIDGSTTIAFCIPVCEKKCINAKCTAPNICTCDRGYKVDPDEIHAFVCVPECEQGCIFGTCTAPNVCTCDRGYTLKSVCEPICSEACVMGTCIAPESCSCFTGYGLLEDSKYNCVPICEKICLNGKCTEPDICTCNKGFRSSENELEKHICKPHCEIPCEPFGVCTAPNVCTCFEGYRLADKTQTKDIDTQYFVRYALPDNSICKPECDAECINGFCSAPNTCNCYYGYHPSDTNANICEPTCSQNCVNGFCSSPENCTCNEGYRPSKNTSSNICEPFCESDCINGYCSAPNKCACNANYRPTEGNRTNPCEPICNPSCKNGICIRPNVCDCDPGYNQSTHSMNECEPICRPACGTHGICEEPDRCVCENGYRMVYYDDKDVPFMCSPICNVNCGNGTCAAPDLCTCFDGYQNAETGRCEPVCSMCNNGTCVAPDICKCNDGFVLEDAKIDIEVSDIEISEFKDDRQSNGSKCIPYCESCDNGECVAPGECRCYAGFVEIEGTCMHACRDGCGTHGKCIDEHRVCECDYGWSGLRCDQPTMCISILNNVENRTDQLNIIEERNATIDQVFMNSPKCSECSDKINNETLCFKMYTNDTEDDTQIGCLINAECFALSQYMDQKKIIKLTGIAGVGILLLLGTAITTYILLQKRRNREMDDEQIADYSTSMQRLLEQNTNTS